MLRKVQIYGVVLFSGVFLSAWFFPKISQRDFYTHYFRMIEEINVRNSHSISLKTVTLSEFFAAANAFSSPKTLFWAVLTEETRESLLSHSFSQYCKQIFPSFSFSFTERLHSQLRLDFVPLF